MNAKNRKTKRDEMRNKGKAKIWKASFLWSFWRQTSDTHNYFIAVAPKPRKRIASIPVVI